MALPGIVCSSLLALLQGFACIASEYPKRGATFHRAHDVPMACVSAEMQNAPFPSLLWHARTPEPWSSTACVLYLPLTAAVASGDSLMLYIKCSGTTIWGGWTADPSPSPDSLCPWKTFTQLLGTLTHLFIKHACLVWFCAGNQVWMLARVWVCE